jgi:glycine/serine hydroxymethyltransferase
MLAATIEMNAFKTEYQAQVLSNAKAFAGYCAAAGIPVEGGESEGYTHTHQVLLRVSGFGDAKEVATRLESNNIITNYQALPGDETFYRPSGIRMGVQEMTRYGMKESDFEQLARLIADTVVRRKEVANEVSEFRSRFCRMEYCLTYDETMKIVPALFESLFPGRDSVRDFANSLAG